MSVAIQVGVPGGLGLNQGIGVIRDPVTGKRTAGRTLDPDDAVAAGHDTWRDWYLTDQHAERMRLQLQAQRDRNANQAENPSDIVTLPGPEGDE